MSAYIRPPGVVNPSPWEQALATTKRDTAGDWIPAAPNPFGTSVDYTAQGLPGGNPWSAPSTQVPTTAPSTTSGAASGGWDLPGWAYGGNQKGGATYNQQTGNWDVTAPLAAGADVFGAKLPYAYDGNQDRGGLEYNGKNVETFWSRALRFAHDYTAGGVAPQQAMQMALDRIKRDNGGTLQGTGFQDTGGTAAAGGAAADGAGGSQGGSTVAGSMGGGVVAGAQAAGNSGGGQNAQPNPVPGTTAGGSFGQMQGVNPDFLFNAAQQDPGVAAHLLRLAHGQSGPVTSRLGQFADSLYGRALQTYLALGGVGGTPTGFGAMQGFLNAQNSGGGIQGLLNTAASNASGANFAGQDETQVEKVLRAAIALKSLGMGSLGGSLMSGDLENLLYQQQGQGLTEGPYGPSSSGGLARGLSSDPYGQALQQYLALQR